jgi:HlyD family secretion protein
MMKKWIKIGAMIAAAGVALAVYQYYRSTHQTDPPKPLPTATVRRGTLAVHVYATGTVQANRTVNIKCLAGGQIRSKPYEVIGDPVKKGQIILNVDPTVEEQALNIARQNLQQAKLNYQTSKLNYQIAKNNLITTRENDQANLLSMEAQVANDQLNLHRDQTLLVEKLASQQTFDNDKTTLVRDQQSLRLAQVQMEQLQTQALQVQLQKLNVQLAHVAVESKRQERNQAETNLKYTHVKAPISGVVSTVYVQPGQVISSALTNVGGGTTVMNIVDLSHIFVNATINESDINHVRIGDKVQITAPGAPGEVFPGRVELIAPVSIQDQNSNSNAIINSNIITFEAKIEVLGKNKDLLKPGMTADVDIFADKLKNVLYIPLQAVVINNGLDTVAVVNPNGSTTIRTVNLGKRNDLDWQVTGGLREGQKVQIHLGNAQSMWTPWRH